MHNFAYLHGSKYQCTKCGAAATKANITEKIKTPCTGDTGDEVIKADVAAIQLGFAGLEDRVTALEATTANLVQAGLME